MVLSCAVFGCNSKLSDKSKKSFQRFSCLRKIIVLCSRNKRFLQLMKILMSKELANLMKLLFESDNHILQKRMNSLMFDQKNFLNQDSRTRYYTDLHSYKTLFLIHEEVYQRNPPISPFSWLISTFLKLRLNLPLGYLMKRFVGFEFFFFCSWGCDLTFFLK